MFFGTRYIYRSGCLKGGPPIAFLFSLLFVFTHAFDWGTVINRYGISLHYFLVSPGFGLVIRMFFRCEGTDPLRFAVVGLCVEAVVAVHFDFNRIRLERLFPIFFLQR